LGEQVKKPTHAWLEEWTERTKAPGLLTDTTA
jgi:hypothetical protein